MQDVIFVTCSLIFFVAGCGYIALCDRLMP